MNINIELFNDEAAGPGRSMWTVVGGVGGSIFLYVGAIEWCKHKLKQAIGRIVSLHKFLEGEDVSSFRPLGINLLAPKFTMECEDVSLFGPLGTSLLIPKFTIESGGEIGDVSLFGPLGTNLFTPISAIKCDRGHKDVQLFRPFGTDLLTSSLKTFLDTLKSELKEYYRKLLTIT
ncbi:hypothetical protein F2Q68_00003192 [Brassica cretica]|uniref:Uncharacterized protein n=2 Tax=Brassica cretica TaxID=69181 RepID=A0A8S9JI98_BRACR|nr:hypothetical protein F2Q68_00003192 [Brassica cretica]KAF3552186.1 hypothetical protein DY000_02004588 [Brassica cretica]